MLIAQITDFHLDGTETTRGRLRRVVDALSGTTTPVDFVVVSGDIVQAAAFEDAGEDRAIEEYRFAHQAVSGLAPMAWCPGNADGKAYDVALRDLFPGVGETNARVDADGLTFLMLDSRVAGELRGHLDEDTLAWLEEELAGSTAPTIIVLHHPPVAIGHPVFDTVRLDNAGALEAILLRSPQVIGTLFGHTHMAIVARFAGRPVFGAPGVHSHGQLPWDAREGEPLIDPSAPPAYAVHRIDDDGITSIPSVIT
jgi:3',5'-cyclic-AMP phosphodiesterase